MSLLMLDAQPESRFPKRSDGIATISPSSVVISASEIPL